MINIKKIWYCVALGAAIVAAGCKEDSFKVSGKIDGASDEAVVIECADYSGRWTAIDSTRTNRNGCYTLKVARPLSPEIYRVGVGGKYVYIPVDSVETLHLDGTLAGFDHDFTLSGTPKAERMMAFEKEANMLASVSDPDSVARFKRKVYNEIIYLSGADILSYYVLTKTLEGKYLFDPTDDADMRYYAAVANMYKQYKPNDPHAAMLEQTALEAMRQRNSRLGRQGVVEAQAVGYFDISLPDENGETRSLSDMVGRGKKVVLVFAPISADGADALYRELLQLYNSKGGAIDFYHVSIGEDMYAWREGARKLPWTTVLESAGTSPSVAVDYNLDALPAFFVLDGEGNITSKSESVAELRGKL